MTWRLGRYTLAAAMVAIGVTHFIAPRFFVEIMPAYLPAPLELVYLSGLFEILGGVGLLVERTRRVAAWGLIALYVAVFPANINMAVHQITPTGFDPIPAWLLWARLPLQLAFVAWAWLHTRPHRRPRGRSAGRASVALLVLGLLGCAASPPPSPAKAPVNPGETSSTPAPVAAPPDCPRSTTLEPAGVRDELVCLLRRYVQIDTTNPPGNELAAARFLKSVLAREGIEARIIESAPGRANLYARLKGTGKGQAVVLMHHMDVVPADAREWSVPPFSGELRDGFVWGRGALDNKGAGIVDLMTVLMLHRAQVRLPHDVILLGVADEEAGGGLGARYLVEHHRELFADVGAVLNEGGAILQRGSGPPLYTVELSQKAPLWLRLTARGKSGHGSSPHPAAATHVLARALARLEAHRFPITVLPEVQALFTARARTMPEAERAPYLDLARSLQDDDFRERFLANPRDAALVRNTLSITQLGGSDKENVVPATATAVLDLRLLPGQQPAAVIEELRRVIAEPAVEIETLLSWQAHSSSSDTPMFRAIESHATKRDPDSPVVANVIGGFTDCNAFRAAGMTCYGFMPIRLTPADFAGLHGKNERIGVAQLAEAVVALSDLLRLPM